MKKLSIIGICGIMAILSVAFILPGEKYFEISKSLDIFSTLFKEVNTYYVDEIDPDKLVKTGINSMLNSLDPYTDFIPEEDAEAFSIQTTGQYAGIGALVTSINKKVMISNPYIGFPAYNAGIKVGDEIIEVDGRDVRGGSTNLVTSLLKGKPKTEVQVVVRRIGMKEDLKLKITRERIKVKNVAYQAKIDENTGYIKLDEFTLGASREVEEALISLKKAGAKALIIDLRDNPGGLLYEAVNIANIFLPKGIDIVSTKGKAQEWNKTYKSLNNPVDPEIPLAVLISNSTASASEIVAGSLQDYDRAVLIGQKTFGKGLVQTTRPLAFNAQLKVTTAKYYIPSGRCIQALDYSRRNSDGSVNRFADSVKSVFKTKNGRKVYDGGGLDPDVVVGVDEPEQLLTALFRGGFIFEYANLYCAEYSKFSDLKQFKLTDAEYEKFVAWLKQQNFSFQTEMEKQMKEMVTEAKSENYYDELSATFANLDAKIKSTKTNALIRYKTIITNYLEEEIAFHYNLDQGKAEVSFDSDAELQAAIKLLSEKQQYVKVLSGANGSDSKP